MTENYSDTLFEEIKLLAKFPTKSHLEGIKVHNEAGPSVLNAAKSLFEKGLITRDDGGYLTDSGIEIADHLHRVLAPLS